MSSSHVYVRCRSTTICLPRSTTRPLWRWTAIFFFYVLLGNQAFAAAILSGDRFVYPTVVGDEFAEQAKIITDADAIRASDGGVSKVDEAVRLIGGAPPSQDQLTLGLLKQALSDPESKIRIRAIEGLKNLARAEDQKEYTGWGGTYDLVQLRRTVIAILIPALDDKSWKVVSEAASALAEVPPTDTAVIDALLKAYDGKWDVINPNLDSLRALYWLSSEARRRGLTDWLPALKKARDHIAKARVLTGHGAYRGLIGEIEALQNAADLERWRWIKQNWPTLVYTAVAAHLACFLVVIFAARWSIKCRRLIYDPVFAKFSIYIYPFLRFFWPLQSWILQAYTLQRARELRDQQKYIPVPLTVDGREIFAPQLIAAWTQDKRIWVIGKSGMGKTSLCRYIERLFYSDVATVTAWGMARTRGLVPLLINARDFGDIEIDMKAEPDGWVIAACQRVLSQRGLPIEDKGIIRGMLRSGKIGVIIDGIGETKRSGEVLE